MLVFASMKLYLFLLLQKLYQLKQAWFLAMGHSIDTTAEALVLINLRCAATCREKYFF